MGNFCEQIGLPPIAPSRRQKKKPYKFIRKRSHHIKKRRFNKPDEKIFRKPGRKNIKPSKGKCFNNGKKWHYADKCPNPPGKLKNKINSLKIDEEERNDLIRILQSRDSSNFDSSYMDDLTNLQSLLRLKKKIMFLLLLLVSC